MTAMLAIDGGIPVRTEPFGPMHDFGDEDIEALAEVVRSGVLGKGPKVHEFEEVWASRHGVEYAVAVTSGTAAMHTCVGAINPDPGDEIIVTPWTSGGSIIGALLHNCLPVFADVDDTFTLDTDILNCTAAEYANAVSAEGVKLGGPYIGSGRQGPLFRNEFLAAPNLYGRSRFPLDYQRETPVDYRQTRLPYGEELMARGVTLSMRPSFGEEDIGDIIHAMRKVADAFKSRGR